VKVLAVLTGILLMAAFQAPCQGMPSSELNGSLPDSLQSLSAEQLLKYADDHYDSNLSKALLYARSAILKAEQEGNKQLAIQANLTVSRTFRRQGNFTLATEHVFQAFLLLESYPDTTLLISAHITLGNIYSSLKNYPEAGQHFLTALHMAEQKQSPQLASCLAFLGRNCGKLGLYDSALNLLRKSKEIELRNPQPGFALLYIYNYLGEVHTDAKHLDEARYFFALARSIAEERKNPFGQTFTFLGLAALNLQEKKFAEARAAALQALDIACKHDFRDRAKLAYELLYKSYESENDLVQAYKYRLMFDSLEESIFSEDKLNYIQLLKLKLESEKMTRENEALRKAMAQEQERFRKRLTWVINLTILVIFVLVVYFLRQSLRRQRKRIKELASSVRQGLEKTVKARTLELSRQTQQMEQFSYIIAHNLKAPIARMQGLINLISLQSGKSEELEKLKICTQELESTLSDLMDILRVKTSPLESVRKVDIGEVLQKIRFQLQDKIEQAGAEIETQLDLQEVYTVPAYLESILFNLISNSIKYRSAKRPLRIRIESREKNGYCIISVNDNGLGFDPEAVRGKIFQPYQRFHSHIDGKGLGLYMVKTQLESLGGILEFESQPDQGTTFTCHIPANAHIEQE
jgi:signal transduction histidine kinase